MIEAKAHSPFYCKPLSFSVGKEKYFKNIDKDNILEVKGLYLDKNAGKVYFVLDDAYVEIISFYDWIANKDNEMKKERKKNELEKWN